MRWLCRMNTDVFGLHASLPWLQISWKRGRRVISSRCVLEASSCHSCSWRSPFTSYLPADRLTPLGQSLTPPNAATTRLSSRQLMFVKAPHIGWASKRVPPTDTERRSASSVTFDGISMFRWTHECRNIPIKPNPVMLFSKRISIYLYFCMYFSKCNLYVSRIRWRCEGFVQTSA